MAKNEVSMDIPQVQAIANSFGSFQDTLTSVSSALDNAINMLKTSGFIGLVGDTAVDSFVNTIKPGLDGLARQMGDLKADVQGAIQDYQTGDKSGSDRFRSKT